MLKLPVADKLDTQFPNLKLCLASGRQVSVRDLHSDKMSFLPIKDPLDRITCMTSGYYGEKYLVAVAFTERSKREDEEVLGIEIFQTHLADKIVPECKRVSYRLQRIEEPKPEQKPAKTTGCEYHKHESKATQNNKEAAKPQAQYPASYISQMTFSHNLKHLACLITGGQNGILVYETGLPKPKVEKFFDIAFSDSLKPSKQELTQLSFYPVDAS